MNNAILLHADEKWSLFENNQVLPLLDYPKIESPIYVMSDFDGSISGVSVVNNKSSYAESLIGRRLRDDGLIDGEVKIITHYGAQTDGGYQVLYTAVPMNSWQNMYSWTQAQKEHCLLVPKTTLMHALLSQANEGVVFHWGRRFSVLVRQQKTLAYFSVLALGDSHDDLQISARTLAERVRERQAEGTERLLKYTWYSFGVSDTGEEAALAKVFREITGASVTVAATEAYTKKNGGRVYAPFTELRAHLSEKLAVNPGADKVSFFAENNLMRIAACVGVIAAGLFIWGLVSLLQARIVLAQSEQNALDAQNIAQSLQGKTTVAQQGQGKQFYATRDFVGLVTKAQRGVDPYAFLRSLRLAAGDNVKILRVQMPQENNSIVIEGWVEQTGGNDKPLADFVEQLRALGFSPQAIDSVSGANVRRNGSFAYRLQPVSDDERGGV